MNPNNGSQSGGAPNPSTPQDDRSAAANVLRSQIDALYGDTPTAAKQAPIQHITREHAKEVQPEEDQWKAYHSAWQTYYQQYYAAYYEHQQKLASAKEVATPTESHTSNTSNSQNYFAHTQGHIESPKDHTPSSPQAATHEAIPEEDISKNEALYELRQKLLGKVSARAKKIRKSRHFVPVAAAFGVILAFLFLQYNQVLFAAVNAYVSPGSIDVQNIVIDPSGSTAVGEDPRLVIPKINVDVPVLYDVGSGYDSQMDAMAKGVAHFSIPGANSHPGEIGNTVISGHSSNDLFDGGEYKFIFAQLDKLETGDTVYANYKGTRYTYVITKKEVVMPTEVSKLVYTTNKPMLTLITCTPLGTSQKRLLVTAEQVSPDPAAAAAAPAGSGEATDGSVEIPGSSSPTLLEKLFGA